MTDRRPELRWEPAADTDGAVVELCRDRACTEPIETLRSEGKARPTDELPAGVVFWRLRGRRGESVGADTSPTWQMTVGARDASVGSAWGSVVDVDGDGWADAVVAAPGARKVYVYEGSPDGLGDTPAAQLADPDGGVDGVFGRRVFNVGDVDGDGFGDVAVGDGLRLFVHRGSAAGLSASPSTMLVLPNEDLARLGAGDFDADGYGDVVAVTWGTTTELVLFPGSAEGLSNVPSSSIQVGPAGGDPESDEERVVDVTPLAADVNGDGFADVIAVIGTYDSAGLRVALGSASGLQASTEVTRLTPEGTDPRSVVGDAGDYDGDGYADVAVVYESYTESGYVARLSIFAGGPSGLSATAATSFGLSAGETHSDRVLATDDVTGDGLADLAIGRVREAWGDTPAKAEVRVFAGDPAWPAASSATPLAVPTGEEEDFGTEVAADDVDGDGVADVLVGAPGAASAAGKLYLFAGGAPDTSSPTTVTGPDGINGRFADTIGR